MKGTEGTGGTKGTGEYSFCMSFLSSRWMSRLVCALLIISALLGAWKLGQQVAFELGASFESDAGIYLAVARGMTHGLAPYRDLFENKAPGVFAMAMLSIELFGDHRLLT